MRLTLAVTVKNMCKQCKHDLLQLGLRGAWSMLSIACGRCLQCEVR